MSAPRRWASLVALCLALALSGPTAALAATTGNIRGQLIDEATGKGLPGVTVVASGPQGDSTEFTDSAGRYVITDLTPGTYTLRFYYAEVNVEREGVVVEADKTVSAGAVVPTNRVKVQTLRVREPASSIDVGSAQVSTQLTDDLLRSTPVGRSYDSVVTLAPGAATDAVGHSFNGSTGPENTYLIDGLNTTSPGFGLAGTQLSLEFIKEAGVVTGGAAAELGRSTGGVVNLVTKSGTNEFHGGAWAFYRPFTLDPQRTSRPGEAIASLQKPIDKAFDIGVDVGGPIVKNRLFFYVGFNPSVQMGSYDRILRTRTANDLDPKMTSGSYAGDSAGASACPAWIRQQSPELCAASATAAARTGDLPRSTWRHYDSMSVLYNAIAKLTLRVDDNNTFDLSYIASPSTFEGLGRNPNNPMTGSYPTQLTFNANPDAQRYSQPMQVHDVVLHYLGKYLDRRLHLDVRLGYHYEDTPMQPLDQGGATGQFQDTRTMSLNSFEKGVTACAPQIIHGVTFNPCPVTNYYDGGFGWVPSFTFRRASAAFGLTYFLQALGTHAIKLGGDVEWNQMETRKYYTGGDNGGIFQIFDGSPTPTVNRVRQFATVAPDGSVITLVGGTHNTTSSTSESLYLRDAWTFGFLPGFTLSAGVRWDAQQITATDGSTPIALNQNFAPRVGFAYDFLGKGRSRLYANYAQLYEQMPLDLADRSFSGEGGLYNAGATSCMYDGARVVPGSCRFPPPGRGGINGGTYAAVSPYLQGQYSNEFVGGLDFNVGWDVVLGAAFVHRDLGRIIEDLSPDGGNNYIIGNPGASLDSGTVANLQKKIRDLGGATDPKAVQDRDNAIKQLAFYKASANFEKPRRDYNALVLTLSKRLSHNFVVLASYTYSRTEGNYPGLFSASNGQLDPNLSSQYDLPELLKNRTGPLPTDRPHNFKLTGSYFQPVGKGGFTFGANFFVLSGTPIEVLGAHPWYGPNETFILPRGSGGRTPTLTQLDLRVAYALQVSKHLRAELSWDVFNVFNQQTPTLVDQAYTNDPVEPIVGGTYADLKHLKTTSGTTPNLNPNYGQPTAYQAPLSMRFGARLSF